MKIYGAHMLMAELVMVRLLNVLHNWNFWIVNLLLLNDYVVAEFYLNFSLIFEVFSLQTFAIMVRRGDISSQSIKYGGRILCEFSPSLSSL